LNGIHIEFFLIICPPINKELAQPLALFKHLLVKFLKNVNFTPNTTEDGEEVYG